MLASTIIEVKLNVLDNASFPMLTTVEGIVTWVNESQFSSAFAPILVTSVPILTLLISFFAMVFV